jgi:hypothetical protein
MAALGIVGIERVMLSKLWDDVDVDVDVDVVVLSLFRVPSFFHRTSPEYAPVTVNWPVPRPVDLRGWGSAMERDEDCPGEFDVKI